MFTPFFPVRLRDAFALAQLEDDDLRKELPTRCPEFKRMRERVKKLPDVSAESLSDEAYLRARHESLGC